MKGGVSKEKKCKQKSRKKVRGQKKVDRVAQIRPVELIHFDLYDDLVDRQTQINECSTIHDYSHEQADSLVIFDEVRRLFSVKVANLEEN